MHCIHIIFLIDEQSYQIIIAHFLLHAMASSSDNPTQNEEHTRKGGENGGYGEDDFASSLDLLQGKFRKCNLDPLLFGPHPIQSGDPAHFPMNWKNISDNEVIIFLNISISHFEHIFSLFSILFILV